MTAITTIATSLFSVLSSLIGVVTGTGNEFLLVGVAAGFVGMAVTIFKRLARG